MAVSTAGTYLYYKGIGSTTPSTPTKLLDIISYPDMGATPNKIDTTDLSALKYKTSILGLQDIPDLTFEANYDKAVYTTIEGLAGKTYEFQLWFGDAGADGIFTWQGEVQIYATGGGVDEARKMTVILSAETEIVQS